MCSELECLLKERENQTVNIAASDETQRKSFFFMLTLFGIFAGVYTNNEIIKSHDARTWVLIVLSQLIFLNILKWVMEFSLQMLHVGLNRALETRINAVLGKNVMLWDSHVTFEYITKPKSSVYLASALLWIAGYIGYGVVGWLVWKQPDEKWFAWVLIVEAVIFPVLIWLALCDIRRVEASSGAILGLSITPNAKRNTDMSETRDAAKEKTDKAFD